MGSLKSGVICILIGISLGSAIVWNIQGAKIDILRAESNILKRNIRLEAEHSKRQAELKEKRFDKVLAESEAKWKEQQSASTAILNRMQHDRNAYRAQLMSKIAESSRVSNELCFTRAGFESAVQQLDESLSGIIGQCLNTETRLAITKDWYDNIKGIE